MTAIHIPTPDFVTYDFSHRVTAAATGDRALTVTWSDGRESVFHYLWLRDCCACKACTNPATREQMFEIMSVPPDIRPSSVSATEAGALDITWDHEGHRSLYHPGWLRRYTYDTWAAEERPAIDGHRQTRIWDASLGTLPAFDAAAVLEDDGALLAWLVTLRDLGAALLKDMPTRKGMLEVLAARISFIRETNFGRFFDVIANLEENDNSTAYTALELPPHTDLPTRELEPGYQFLHCLSNAAKGGDSILVDGFGIAEHLRREEPDTFAMLTETPYDWHNTDPTSDYRFRAPVIGLDRDGGFDEIRFGNFIRGPFSFAADRMEAACLAYRRFQELTKDLRFRIVFRLEPGDVEVFDNRRVLHARTGFAPETGHRALEGCYVDRDEILSRIRVLRRTVSD